MKVNEQFAKPNELLEGKHGPKVLGLGQQALGRDAGFDLPVRVWTDSSAAIRTASRQGLGKLRHLECHSLWVQQRLRRKLSPEKR